MGTCIAYLDDGTVCRRPATHVDTQRGGLICAAHIPPRPKNVRDRIALRRRVWPADADSAALGEGGE